MHNSITKRKGNVDNQNDGVVDDKRHYTNTFTPTTQCHSHKSNGKICFHLVWTAPIRGRGPQIIQMRMVCNRLGTRQK